MANQIARNVAHEPDPVATVADHIVAFWSGRMRAQIAARL
ncbi:formate dehydrogenase subunit delta, partial [Acinetobacter baumannii]